LLTIAIVYQFYKILTRFGVIAKVGDNDTTTYGKLVSGGQKIESKCYKQFRAAFAWVSK